MSLSKKLVVVAVSAMAVVGFTASSAMADTAVMVNNPGTVQLHSSSSVLTSSGTPIANCDVVIDATLSTGGIASGVSFTITGPGLCSSITASSTGGAICNDGSSDYLKAQVTVNLFGSPVASGNITGGITSTQLTFANSQIGSSSAAIDGVYDADPELELEATEDACSI